MYSNGGIYIPGRKPPMGIFRNPYLKINRGLVLDTMMWEGAGPTVEDLSGYGNIGTEQQDSVWQPGKFGPCRYFSGNDYICIPDNPSLNPSSQLTIVVWVKQTSIGTTEVWVGKESAANNRSYYLRSYTVEPGLEDYIEFIISSDGTTFNTWRTGNNIITAGVWNQIAAVYNSGESEPRLYFNAQYIAGSWGVGSMPASLFDNSALLEFGTRRSGDDLFTGLLDIPLIYNRALTVGEIVKLYQEPFCGFRWASIEQLVVYYEAVVAGGIMTTNTGYWGAL